MLGCNARRRLLEYWGDMDAGERAILEEIRDDVQDLTRTIRGFNDTPGLVGRIAVMEDRQDTQRWWTRAIVPGVVISLFVAIGGAIWQLLRAL